MENTRSDGPTLSEVGDRMRADVDLLRQTIEKKSDELRRAAVQLVDEHPYGALAAAFGLGYVLSGALFSRVTARALIFGGRFIVGNLLRQAVGGGAFGFAMGSTEQQSVQP
jgi:hypothetical protein